MLSLADRQGWACGNWEPLSYLGDVPTRALPHSHSQLMALPRAGPWHPKTRIFLYTPERVHSPGAMLSYPEDEVVKLELALLAVLLGQGLILADFVAAADDEWGALMHALRFDVHDASEAVGRHAAGLFG